MTLHGVSFNCQTIERNNEANQRMPQRDEPAGVELRERRGKEKEKKQTVNLIKPSS
jgi:hypothetical protein